MGRRIFVGDIQGCAAELRRLLDEVRFDPARDELHPAGDLVNRGPASIETLRLLRMLGAGGVLGNHDVHLLRVAAGKEESKWGDTVGDVLAAPDREELLDWLAMRPFVRSWPDLVLVHAGVHPGTEDPRRAPAVADAAEPDEAAHFALHVRYCSPDGTRPEKDHPPPGPPFRPWFDFYAERTGDRPRVVFGHWARLGLVCAPFLRGLDTGCVWGGRLSAWIAEEDRIVSVPAERRYATKDA